MKDAVRILIATTAVLAIGGCGGSRGGGQDARDGAADGGTGAAADGGGGDRADAAPEATAAGDGPMDVAPPSDAGPPDAPAGMDAAVDSGPGTTGSTRLCDPGGWCWVHPLPTGNDLLTILERSPSDVWLGGWYGALLHWDGAGWTNFPLAAGRLSALAAEPSGAVWVVGDQGLAARFDGMSFRITDTGTQFALFGVAAVGPNQVYAVGDAGTVLFWDGVQWTPVALDIPIPESASTRPETLTLSSVWGSGPGDVWVGGAGVLWRKQGDTWARVPGATRAFTAIAGTSATEVWLAASDGTVQRWDGNVLSIVRQAAGFAANGLWVGGPNDVWVSLYQSIEHWDGNTWTPISLSYSVTGMSGTSSGDVWGAGDRGDVGRWNGRTWASAPPAAAGETAPSQLPYGVRALWVSAANDVWLASFTSLYHFDGSAVTPVSPRPGSHNINALWGSGPHDVWGFGAGGEIIHWDGASWTLAENTGTNEFLDGRGSSATDVWAVGLYSAYHFDGASWSLDNAGAVGTPLQAVYAAAPGAAWAGGFNDLLMRWNGQQWTQETSIPVSNFTSGIKLVWGTSATNVWAFGEHGYHYDGQSWMMDAAAPTPQHGWGSGANDFWGLGSTSVFHFDGANWTPTTPEVSFPQAIAGLGPGGAWIGCAGGVLRRAPTP